MTGWRTKELGELCDFQRGLTYGKSDEVDVSNNVVLRANNVDLATHTLDLSDLRYISDSVSVPATKKVRRGSLLICTASGSKSHLGKVAYVDEDYGYAFGGFMGQLTPAAGVDGRYLFHALTSPGYKEFIAALSDGMNINNLKFDDLSRFPLPVPPLTEQRRIVAILDEAFKAIAIAKANAEKNLRNAQELFELQRDACFAEENQSWPAEALGDIAEVQSGGTPLVSTKEFWGGDIAWYSSGELNDVETVQSERFITEAGLAGSNAKLFPKGSLLIGMYDTAALKMSILDRAAAFNQAIAGVRPNQNLEMEFLFHAISVQKPALLSLRRGVRQKNLSLGKIKEIVVPVPSIEAQRCIIGRLNAAQELSDRLQAAYQGKLAAFDELKKSLLSQAFSGQLTDKAADEEIYEVA